MLGRSLPKGSEAIQFHNTLFRVSELCWVKAVRLSIPEMIIKVASFGLAVAWVMAMKSVKGSYLNVEFLLAGFPLLLAWTTSGSLKIGCSGDFEEAYDSRQGLLSSPFRGWIETLHKKKPDWLHLQSSSYVSSYDLIINPNRVAWIRPCVQWKLYPLLVAGAFWLYLKIVSLGHNFGSYPVFEDLQILVFNSGMGNIETLAYAIIGVSVAAFLASIKRSVEVCGTGGVQDVFPLTSADQQAVLNILAGTASPKQEAKPTPAPKAPEKPKEASSKPTEAPAPAKPKPSEKPTAVLADEMKKAAAGKE